LPSSVSTTRRATGACGPSGAAAPRPPPPPHRPGPRDHRHPGPRPELRQARHHRELLEHLEPLRLPADLQARTGSTGTRGLQRASATTTATTTTAPPPPRPPPPPPPNAPAIAMYCLPSSMKVIGGPGLPVRPVAMSATCSPVSALNTSNRFATFVKTRLPAVASVPPAL
jgi:hypothetical protein